MPWILALANPQYKRYSSEEGSTNVTILLILGRSYLLRRQITHCLEDDVPSPNRRFFALPQKIGC
jgi:hypothetical protein